MRLGIRGPDVRGGVPVGGVRDAKSPVEIVQGVVVDGKKNGGSADAAQVLGQHIGRQPTPLQFTQTA